MRVRNSSQSPFFARCDSRVHVVMAVAVVAVGVLDLVPFRSENLVAPGQGWIASGSFARGGPGGLKFDIGIPERERRNVDFWSGGGGEVRSPVFPAPAMLECFLAGYPGKAGARLYLERVADRQEFALTIDGNGFPGETWRAFHWRVPAAFRGQMVQLVAADTSEWMGVSTPRRFSYLGLLHQQLPRSFSLLGRTVLSLAVFLLPGFAATFWLIDRWPQLLRHALILIVAGSATLGYAAFYVYFFSRAGGQWFSFAIALAAIALVGLAALMGRSRGSLLLTMARQVAEPFALTAATAVCYLSFAYLFVSPASSGADYINGRFFRFTLPGDNVIPRIFAEKIYQREPIRPFCCGDWLSSDRPPLQTGIFLMERAAPWIKNADFEYEVQGTALQCLWIAGVWAFLSSLGTAVATIRRAVLFLIFSGAVFFNCVYTWPKFLTATFILFTVSLVIEKLRDRSVPAGAILASVCLGLALVSHPGSIYSLAALSILLFRFRRRLRWRLLAAVIPIVLAFVLPWMAYQKFADPPGDRLIKWHLAGHPEPDSLSAWQEVRRAYSSHTAAEIAALRWGNLRYLFGGPTPYPFSEDARENARQYQREFFFLALGVLNFGFVAAVFAARRGIAAVVPFAGWIVAAVLVNLAVWCCAEFGPKMTPLVHSSYADFLMLSAGLLGFLLALPRVWIAGALVLQAAEFWVVWVWSPPASVIVLQVPLVVMGVGIAVGLVVWLMRSVEMSGGRPLTGTSPAPGTLALGGKEQEKKGTDTEFRRDGMQGLGRACAEFESVPFFRPVRSRV